MRHMLRTPFATGLSRSARETERRIRNICFGPKKDPPRLLVVLTALMVLLCGNLVSCQTGTPDQNGPARLGNTRNAGGADRPIQAVHGVPVDPDDPPQGEEEWLLQALLLAAEGERPFQDPAAHLYGLIQKGGRVFGAAFVEDHLENTLLLGMADRETRELTGPLFRCAVHAGVANVVTFQNDGGEYCLLYTLNGQQNGQYTGQAGLVRFDGEDIVWRWPAEGDVRDADSAAARAYQEYWTGHLALTAPGGVDVYAVNPDFGWGKEEPASMWRLEHDETFYRSDKAGLPIPIYFQSLEWLNETTGGAGGWKVVSLRLNEERCDPENRVDCYTLWAKSWDSAEELTADLFFPYEQTGNRRSYDNLDHGERLEHVSPNPDAAKSDKDGGWDWGDDWDDWDDDWDGWDDEALDAWEREQEAKQTAEYQAVGVTMDGKDYYYRGQLVDIFLDQRPDKSVYTLNRNPAGAVNVKILRDQEGRVAGAAYMTGAEAAELKDLF